MPVEPRPQLLNLIRFYIRVRHFNLPPQRSDTIIGHKDAQPVEGTLTVHSTYGGLEIVHQFEHSRSLNLRHMFGFCKGRMSDQ